MRQFLQSLSEILQPLNEEASGESGHAADPGLPLLCTIRAWLASFADCFGVFVFVLFCLNSP